MGFSSSPPWLPNLEDAIERDPLTIAPTAPLDHAIALLGQSHPKTCPIKDGTPSSRGASPSCLLIMDQGRLLGILTERDIIQLTARAADSSLEWSEATVADIMVHPVVTLSQGTSRNIFSALFIFRRYRIGHLPVIDEHEQLVGLVSYESIRRTLRPIDLLRVRRVSEVMSLAVERAPISTSILALAQRMAERQANHIVLTQPDDQAIDQPVGVITQRDIIALRDLQIDLAAIQAQSVMRSPLFILRPEDSLWRAYQEMQQRQVCQLVVSWNWGRDIGLVTWTSLLATLDPLEIYEVIEAMQHTLQRTQVEAIASLTLEDGETLADSLEAVRQQIDQIISNLELQPEQMRSQISAALEQLEALYRGQRS